MKLTSHGCSFTYGSDLSSSSMAWPALVAQHLGYDYACTAWPGIGNLRIMESVLLHADQSDMCVINWTWIDRFDCVDIQDESWYTIRPALDHVHAEHYYRNYHSQYRDMLTNLSYISTAISFLEDNKIPFLMTNIDNLLYETVQPRWHPPAAVTYLQQKIGPYLRDFEGKNFLDWSRSHNFAVSKSWHPLEQAHCAAAALMLPVIKDLLHIEK